MTSRDVIVVGASAGGVEALQILVAGLPPDLPASVLVVLHISPHIPTHLHDVLARAGPLPAARARDGERMIAARIYVATPDHHLVVQSDDRLRLTRGPRENYSRPSVDTLFRSAADVLGPRVIGVVLSGARDDGAKGLVAIKARGGLALVQTPEDAGYPDMPENALRQVRVDFSLRMADMPALLTRLVCESPDAGIPGLASQ